MWPTYRCEDCDDLVYFTKKGFLTHLASPHHKHTIEILETVRRTPFVCEVCDDTVFYPTHDMYLAHLGEPHHHEKMKKVVQSWAQEWKGIAFSLDTITRPLEDTLLNLSKFVCAWIKNAYFSEATCPNEEPLLIVWFINEDLTRPIYMKLTRNRFWSARHPRLLKSLHECAQWWIQLTGLKLHPEGPAPLPYKTTVEQLRAELAFLENGKMGRPTFYDKDESYRGDNAGKRRHLSMSSLEPFKPKTRHMCAFHINEAGQMIRQLPCNRRCIIYGLVDEDDAQPEGVQIVEVPEQ